MLNTQTCSWQPQLATEQRARATEIAREIAARLRERGNIVAAYEAAQQQTAFPRSVSWQPYTLAQGDAGLALLCGYLDACFPGKGWDVTGYRYLEIAARAAEQHSNLPAGLFSGLSGLTFAVEYLSQGGKRYRKLLAACEETLFPRIIALASCLCTQTHDIAVSQFDLISGLSGMGAYLLRRKGVAGARPALEAILHSLVNLMAEDTETALPRWYTPAHLLWDEATRQLYPYGNLNCGLAHGIPGPLGLLSLAHLASISVDEVEEAIAGNADWLLRHRMDDQWGVNWPTAVAITADGTVPAHAPATLAAPFEPSRSAWCYGSPGIARALWFAGEALNRDEYREVAVAAMEAVYRRPLPVRRIDSPTFCHGIAGLLQITLRFAHDTGLPCFTEAAQTLTEQLLSLYDPGALLGYYSLEPGNKRVEQPGLLDGVPGVVLVLLAATSRVEPTWDRLFLLS